MDIRTAVGLDLETQPCPGQPLEYSLQPWRLPQGKARVSVCAIAHPDGSAKIVPGSREQLRDLLHSLSGRTAVTYNGVFDIAWLLACGLEDDVRRIHWVDAQILYKLADNNQDSSERPEWSLADAAKRWLHDVPWLPTFLQLKAEDVVSGENQPYWDVRAKLDALATVVIAQRVWTTLSDKQRRLATISMRCLVPTAKSWVTGVDVDAQSAANMYGPASAEMRVIEDKLGLRTPPTTKSERVEAVDGWIPSKVLASPKQLGTLIYSTWGLPVERTTDKGSASTDKTALTYLADLDARVLSILRWRELNTRLSKFILGIPEACAYLGSQTTHAAPRLFSTYTGRMTYSTKSSRAGPGAKAKIGVPLHQWPRPKVMRKLIVAPPGKRLVEFDAAGQEARLMAAQSLDPAMLRVFNSPPPYDDIHGFTASRIGGMPFEELLKRKAAYDEVVTGAHGLRNCAKFINLSKQYRTGDKKLRLMARVQYGLDMPIETIREWSRAYAATYAGVPRYWSGAIRTAQHLGYAETLGGRRYGLDRWRKEDEWGTGSSAINFPIQGTGSDMKELAISTLDRMFPELEFMLDLHDGIFFLVDDTPHIADLVADARAVLDSLNYAQAWDWDAPLPMPWDGGHGKSWGEIKK